MSERAFLDSNILLYTLADDPRASVAEAVLLKGHSISVQVLNEFASVATRKKALKPAQIAEATQSFRQLFEVLPLTLQLHDEALRLAGRYGFSFYDALIVAAALAAQCTVLYSEDLQHGLRVEKRLSVVNPFIGE